DYYCQVYDGSGKILF
nr:immunoglobulin light chain junction region [Macaca mulatta]